MAAFPAAKLGALLLKQISKPIANNCKLYAKNSPFFRKYVCMPPAQFYHWAEVKMKMWILNLGKPVNIPVLNEQQAIELGANILGEGVIFAIASLILLNEYAKSAAKEAKKEKMLRDREEELQQKIKDLFFTTEQQATQIRELMRLIYDLEGKIGQSSGRNGGSRRFRDDEKSKPPPPSLPQGSNPNILMDKSGAPDTNSSDPKNSTSKSARYGESNISEIAYSFVEIDLFPDELERRPGYLTLGLNHFYENVYRVPACV